MTVKLQYIVSDMQRLLNYKMLSVTCNKDWLRIGLFIKEQRQDQWLQLYYMLYIIENTPEEHCVWSETLYIVTACCLFKDINAGL